MPLPNYGFSNQEKRRHSELVLTMAPELVDHRRDSSVEKDKAYRANKWMNGRMAQRTTGKLGVDMERKFVIHNERDRDLWADTPKVDSRDLDEARKFASPERQVLRNRVRSSIDSLISGDKLRQLQNQRRPTIGDSPPAPLYTPPSYSSDDFSVPYGNSSGSRGSSMESRAVRFSVPSKPSSSVPMTSSVRDWRSNSREVDVPVMGSARPHAHHAQPAGYKVAHMSTQVKSMTVRNTRTLY